MEVKANVQKRRQDRLRELQTRVKAADAQQGLHQAGDGRPRGETLPVQLEELPLYQRGPLDGERWEDPETAWKLREKELLRTYGDDRVYGGGPGRPQHPAREEERVPGGGFVPTRRMIWAKLTAAAVVFACVWTMFQLDRPWAQQGRDYVTEALTQDFDFQAVSAWYQNTFSGAPAFIPAFGSHKKEEATKVTAPISRFLQPAKGKVTSGFSARLQGVILETNVDALVAAMDEGRIEYSGIRDNTGHTLVVKHAGGYRTTYGYLQPTQWEVGDWVKAGDILGTARSASTDVEDAGSGGNGSGAKSGDRHYGQLYIAVMKDLRYIDPAEVVSFD